MRDIATHSRETDDSFALELARQAADTHPRMSWHELEPILANIWRRGTHALAWDDAATRVKLAWETCRSGGSGASAPAGAEPTARDDARPR